MAITNYRTSETIPGTAQTGFQTSTNPQRRWCRHQPRRFWKTLDEMIPFWQKYVSQMVQYNQPTQIRNEGSSVTMIHALILGCVLAPAVVHVLCCVCADKSPADGLKRNGRNSPTNRARLLQSSHVLTFTHTSTSVSTLPCIMLEVCRCWGQRVGRGIALFAVRAFFYVALACDRVHCGHRVPCPSIHQTRS